MVMANPRPTTLLTGGAGFIGSEVARRLLGDGRQVRIVDRLDGERQERAAVRLAGLGAEVVVADLAETDLAQLLDGVDAVVHLAGRPGVQSSWGAGFDAHLTDNVAVTARLLDAVAERPSIRRVVLASSSSVYGAIHDGAADERRPLAPVSPYGVSKAAVELLAGTYATRGVPVVSLRYFTVYGRGQRPDMAFSRIIEAARTGEPFVLRGDGTQVRDFTHVSDVARATIAAADLPLPPGLVLNVGSGRPIALLDVIGLVEEHLGRAVPLVAVPAAAGDPRRTAADHRLATRWLGWHPEVEIVDGLADQIGAVGAPVDGGPGALPLVSRTADRMEADEVACV